MYSKHPLKFVLLAMVVLGILAVAEVEPARKTGIDRLFEWLKKPLVDFKYGRQPKDSAGSDNVGADSDADSIGGASSSSAGTGSNRSSDATGTALSGSGAGRDDALSQNDDETGTKGIESDPLVGVGKDSLPSVRSSASQAKPLPYWYPMCLFLDSYLTQEQGNTTVKGIVDAAAACGVQLVVFPITVRSGSYPQDPEQHQQVNEMQMKACNIVGKIPGADRASTSMCVAGDQYADAMCNQWKPGPNGKQVRDTDTGGCAQVQSSGKEDIEALLHAKFPDQDDYRRRKKDIKDHGAVNSPPSGQAAPSLIDKNQCTVDIVSHEAIGHSQFGHPNGSGDGFGIGLGTDDHSNGPDHWTAEGCASMRLSAFDNSDQKYKYDPTRKHYYTKIEDPIRQYDLANGKPLFGARRNSAAGGASAADLASTARAGGIRSALLPQATSVAPPLGPSTGSSLGAGASGVGDVHGGDLKRGSSPRADGGSAAADGGDVDVDELSPRQDLFGPGGAPPGGPRLEYSGPSALDRLKNETARSKAAGRGLSSEEVQAELRGEVGSSSRRGR